MTDDLISRLMEDLTSEWQEEVQSATHALASLGQSVVLPLLDAIEGKNPTLRKHAALVLEQLQPQEALPPLIELLSEEEVHTESRIILVRILIDLMGETSIESDLLNLLIKLSDDPDPEIRQLSAKGLGKTDSVSGNVELCKLAQDREENVRLEAQTQLTERSRERKANGIQPLEPAMLEAAARLRVRNGLSHSRREAITELLSDGEDATRDLLPLLEDAGTKTLQEVTPLLKQIKDAKAYMPLMDIVLSQDNPWQRRQIAFRGLQKLSPNAEFIEGLQRKLLEDVEPTLRVEALLSIAASDLEDQMELLSGRLNDPDARVRTQASQLVAERLTPADKGRLRPLLEALHAYPNDASRPFMLQGLARVLVGAPGDQLFAPEILDLLNPSDEQSFACVLDILDKIVSRKPSAQISRSLLALLDSIQRPELIEQVLAILVRKLPRNTTEASRPLHNLLKRFTHIPIQAFVLRLLGRIADKLAVETLIAHAELHPQDEHKVLKQLAIQLLENLEGSLYEVTRVQGQYTYQPGLICRCGGQLAWQVKEDEHEELICQTCQEEYVQLEPFALIPLKELSSPVCFCPTCKRKHPLVLSNSRLPTCPASHEEYVIRCDNQSVHRVVDLEFGLCECCIPAQPLDLRGDEIVCIQTGKRPPSTEPIEAEVSGDTLETATPTFSVSAHTPETENRPPARTTRSGRTTRPSINSPSTLTRIRSFQLRQTLLAETEQTEAPPTPVPPHVAHSNAPTQETVHFEDPNKQH